jgi:hypothetical protein
LISGDIQALIPRFSSNVALDESVYRRALLVASLRSKHGELTPEPMHLCTADGLTMEAQWWLKGQRGGRVGVRLMLCPQEAQVQMLKVTSVAEPSGSLKRAAAHVLRELKDGSFRTLLEPVQRHGWTACDGVRSGTLLVVGPHMSASVSIRLVGEGGGGGGGVYLPQAEVEITPEERPSISW